MENDLVIEGVVDWFNKERGYGFINLNNGTRAFVHYSQIITKQFQTLNANDRVECQIRNGEFGLQALNVVVLS